MVTFDLLVIHSRLNMWRDFSSGRPNKTMTSHRRDELPIIPQRSFSCGATLVQANIRTARGFFGGRTNPR